MSIIDQKNCNIFANLYAENLKKIGINLDFKCNHSRDFWQLLSLTDTLNEYIIVKGPKVDGSGEEFFKKKYQNVFIENNVWYAKEQINLQEIFQKILIESLNQHKWSIKMKWNSNAISACRPIQQIHLQIDNEIINNTYEGIKFDKINEDIPNFESKLQNIENSMLNLNINKNYLAQLVHKMHKPKILKASFDKKYLAIPSKAIEYFLFTEQVALLIYNPKPTNEFIILIEENCNAPINKFEESANAKLEDLYLQFKRDISRSIEEYQTLRNNKLINEHLGTYKDKLQRMEEIAKQINIWKYCEKDINYYHLDIMSEMVQENPNLEGIITKYLKPDLEENNYIKLLDYIDNVYQFGKNNMLPTSSKDPFGIKKQGDFIIEYLLYNELNFDFEKSINWIQQRLKLKLEKINPILNYIKYDYKYIYKYLNLKLSIHNLNRIINIALKIECNEHIDLHPIEQQLVIDSENLSLDTFNDVSDRIIEYIENTTIAPYIERKNLIIIFIQNAKKFIDYESLSDI